MDIREHSVYFDDYNSWDVWHLVPSSRPTPSVPKMRTNYVTVPGRNGTLDLSTALTGMPIYDDRTLDIDFIVLDQELNWMDVYMDVVSKIHGKRMKIRLVDDPGWYYKGCVTVNEFTSNSDYSSISVNCNLEPYKYSESDNADIIRLYIADMANITTSGTVYKQLTIAMGHPVTETGSIKNANQTLTNGSILLTKDTPVRYASDKVYEPLISAIVNNDEHYDLHFDIWSNGTPFGVTSLQMGVHSESFPDDGGVDGLIYANPGGTYSNLTTIRMIKSHVDDWPSSDYLEIKMRWPERSL